MMTREQALQRLRDVLAQVSPQSPDRFRRIAARIRDARDSVISRYRPMFSPESIVRLTASDFWGFLLFQNNQHWDSLHRQGGRITEDMGKLREALTLLVDEGRPLKKRLDQLRPRRGDPMAPGLGRAVITAILQIVYPDKYGVWNTTTEAGMKRLGLWPDIPRAASFGEKYEKVNAVLHEVAGELGVNLWTLDMLWWHEDPHVPKGAGAEQAEDKKAADQAGEQDAGEPSAVFGLEQHLHEFLVDNWERVEAFKEWGLLEEDGEIVGSRYPAAEVGEIDLLAKHRRENKWLVVELKRNQTSDATVGQILRYMAWVRRNLAKDNGKVSGLIICHEVDTKLQYALDGLGDIACMTYEVCFTLRLAPKMPEQK